MISRAQFRYVRLAPRKVRYVLDLVRGKSVTEAYAILDKANRRPTEAVKKLIQSAADSAVKNKKEAVENLRVSKITADQAGMLKRWRSMSMGRAGQILKRLSHITVELEVTRSATPQAKAPVAAKQTKTKEKV